MRRVMCKSAIDRGKLTGADLRHGGSLTIGRGPMDADNLFEVEKVQVVNVNTDFDDAELATFQPRIVFVDEHNRMVPPLRRVD